jgi:hypothetical protein
MAATKQTAAGEVFEELAADPLDFSDSWSGLGS